MVSSLVGFVLVPIFWLVEIRTEPSIDRSSRFYSIFLFETIIENLKFIFQKKKTIIENQEEWEQKQEGERASITLMS